MKLFTDPQIRRLQRLAAEIDALRAEFEERERKIPDAKYATAKLIDAHIAIRGLVHWASTSDGR